MPVAKAQVLVPGLVVRDADPAADAEALERLALWVLQRVAPIVAADPPDGLVIDTTGADHLHGGEQAMLDALVGRLALSGVAARAAVADSWGAAHALARYAARPTFVAPPGHGASVLAPLPLEALRLPETMSSDLRVLGFERIGDLLAQPRAPLALRFGPELGRRLDQALGGLAEPIEPIRPPELDRGAPRLRRADRRGRDDRPLHRQAGGRALRRARGARAWRPAARPALSARRQPHRRPSASARRGRSRDAKRLTRLLCDRIETIDPGFGIELMTLAATVAEPLRAPGRPSASLVEEPTPDVSDLVDILANRVGERRGLSRGAGRERRARALGPPHRAAGAGHRRRLARPLAAPVAPAAASRSRSRRWRCCPTIRRCPSPGAASAGA